MKEIWIINQFANTADMPGHTRQNDLAVFLNIRANSLTRPC